MISESEFAWRSCLELNIQRFYKGRIERVYENGFDVFLDDSIIYFTSIVERLNPLSFLVAPVVLSACSEGRAVVFSGRELTVGGHLLKPGPIIADSPFPKKVNYEIHEKNLQTLHANIKLFGRSSPVKNLILGCRTQKNLLSGAEAQLLEFPPDLERFKTLIGCGDGLTPAFDDLLSGMLLADRRLQRNLIEIPPKFWDFVAEHTTLQSLQQLKFAANGHLNLLTEASLDTLLLENISSAQVVKALNQGHSSGTDLLCGIWLYLSQGFVSGKKVV